MTHSLKNTIITLFSILVMLTSSYVSSAMLMSMDRSSPSYDDVVVIDVNLNKQSEMSDCHSGATESKSQSQADVEHCGVDNCCSSVCSSAFYPLDIAVIFTRLSSSLALHQTLKIGVKVIRIQDLLRPPSA